jgi:hypothetical protein
MLAYGAKWLVFGLTASRRADRHTAGEGDVIGNGVLHRRMASRGGGGGKEDRGS